MGFFDLFKKKKEEPVVTTVANPEEITTNVAEGDAVTESEEVVSAEELEAERKELEVGLEKTKEGFFGKLKRAIAGRTTVDADVLDDLEEVLEKKIYYWGVGLGVKIYNVFFDFVYDLGLTDPSKFIRAPKVRKEFSTKRRDNILSFSVGIIF